MMQVANFQYRQRPGVASGIFRLKCDWLGTMTLFTLEPNGTVPMEPSQDWACVFTRTFGTVPFGNAIRALFAPLKERLYFGTFRLVPVQTGRAKRERER